MSNIFTITNGPFDGVAPSTTDLTHKVDDFGGQYTLWDTHARTRLFLNLFNPMSGWRVEVHQSSMGLSMEDYSLEGGGASPAWLFEAKLFNPAGDMVANATVCQLINCPMAVEIGQTRARGKLYQALGLPGTLGPDVVEEFTDSNRRSVALPKVEPQASAEQAKVTDPVAEIDNGPSLPPESHADEGDDQSDVVVQTELPTPQTEPATKEPLAKASVQSNAMKAIVRQIEVRAKAKGISIPDFGSIQEASAFLATLARPSVPAQTDMLNGGAA